MASMRERDSSGAEMKFNSLGGSSSSRRTWKFWFSSCLLTTMASKRKRRSPRAQKKYNSSRRSSSSRRTWKYEVFLSFRGEDTRHGFTSRLFSALQRKGIFPFKDDTGIHKGDSISRELLSAIEQSRISIVVFSKHYADSTWCLEELAKIFEVNLEPGYTVVPVFYDVDRSEIRNQSGNFKEAFDKHEQNFSDNMEKVQRWRIALTQVSYLSGWDVRTKLESEVIDNIVKETISKLGHKFSNLADDLVGMQSRVEAFEKLLNLESDKVQFVGIWGMPGIGKTTLAAVVYDKISYQFDAACFLSDASGVSKTFGVVRLQEQLLSQTLTRNIPKIHHVKHGTSILKDRLGNRKTLIVVDNVDSRKQLVDLVGRSGWFGAGSRVIITTRDKHLLRKHGVKEVFKVKLLKDDEALQLFCRKAFECDDPLNDFQDLTHNLLQYAQALPLTITMLGSSLFMRQKSEWSTELERLKKNPNEDVMKILQTTYDLLDEFEKHVFLDIACFFKGADVNYVEKIMLCYLLFQRNEITVLRERSLIGIVNGTLWMHDLLQELGRKIVQEESPTEPARRSRLWSYKDLQVVNVKKGPYWHVQAIVLNEEVPEEILLNAEVLSQMSNLGLLILPDVKFLGNLSHLSNKLKFLSWQKFPFSCLPSSFEPRFLGELIMPDSNIRQLWEGKKQSERLVVDGNDG